VQAEEVLEMIKLHNLDGIVLHVARTLPPGNFETQKKFFPESNHYVFIAEEAGLESKAVGRGVGRASMLINTDGSSQHTSIMDPATFLNFNQSDARMDDPILIAFERDTPSDGEN
jgi:hypothetical protein